MSIILQRVLLRSTGTGAYAAISPAASSIADGLTMGSEDTLIFGLVAGGTASITLGQAHAATVWQDRQVRIEQQIDGGTWRAVGTYQVSSVQRSNVVELSCATLPEHDAGRYALYTAVIVARRAATVSDGANDDPTAGGYAGGMINRVLWGLGGRPVDQAATFPLARFYYRCKQASFPPAFGWLSADAPWGEVDLQARAAGLLVWIDAAGVIQVDTKTDRETPVTTLDAAKLIGLSWTVARPALPTLTASVAAAYTTRAIQPPAVIITDTTPRALANGATIVVELRPDQPIARPPTIAVTASDLTGASVTVGVAILDASAGRVRLSLSNSSGRNATIGLITVTASVLAPVAEGRAIDGSDIDITTAIDAETSIGIFDERHAQILAALTRSILSLPRAVYQADVLASVPLALGDHVTLSHAPRGLATTTARVISLTHQTSGQQQTASLLDVADRPDRTQRMVYNAGGAAGDVVRLR